jgi:hypothetical protein
MEKRKRKKTPEERAAERARHDDLTRRLQAAIERYRARLGPDRAPPPIPVRKPWPEMTHEERAAERARWDDLDRRLLAAIERYRALNAEKRRRREAEAS